MIQAVANSRYPNRIELKLGTILGPLASNGGSPPLGFFDPRRDIQLYVDGIRIPIINFSFDVPQNRYLLYTYQLFNVLGTVQIIHHMPEPPFVDTSSPPLVVPGFALVASFSMVPDATM